MIPHLIAFLAGLLAGVVAGWIFFRRRYRYTRRALTVRGVDVPITDAGPSGNLRGYERLRSERFG